MASAALSTVSTASEAAKRKARRKKVKERKLAEAETGSVASAASTQTEQSVGTWTLASGTSGGTKRRQGKKSDARRKEERLPLRMAYEKAQAMKVDADMNMQPLPTLPPDAARVVYENLKEMENQFAEQLKKLCE